jgi:hypothetical protein
MLKGIIRFRLDSLTDFEWKTLPFHGFGNGSTGVTGRKCRVRQDMSGFHS